MATIQKRTTKDGLPRFKAAIDLSGFPYKSRTFEKAGDAKSWAAKTESDMKLGRVYPEGVASKYTFKEMSKRYIKELEISRRHKPRYLKIKIAILQWWEKVMGNDRLSSLTPFTLSKKKMLLLNSGLSNSTVNKYFSVLSTCINTAIEQWGWMNKNPLDGLSKLKESRGRVRYLTEDELIDLLKACKAEYKKPLYLIVILAISTGARKMEILSLRWRDIDLKRERITLEDTKNNERRALHLKGLALKLMKEYQVKQYAKWRPSNGLVFNKQNTQRIINIEREWKRSLSNANIMDFRFHDLRHCTASYMAMNGASAVEIAEVLGHKTINMAGRYTHLSDTHASQVVASMNEKVFGNLNNSMETLH